jgi:hypothetical protein
MPIALVNAIDYSSAIPDKLCQNNWSPWKGSEGAKYYVTRTIDGQGDSSLAG